MNQRKITLFIVALLVVFQIQGQETTASPSKLEIISENRSQPSYFKVDVENGNTQMELLNTTTDSSADKHTIFTLNNKRAPGASHNGGATLLLLEYDYSINNPSEVNKSSLVFRNDDVNNAYISFWNYNAPNYDSFNESKLLEVNSTQNWARMNLSTEHVTQMKWEFDGEEKMQINSQGQLSLSTQTIPTIIGSRDLSEYKFFVNGGVLAKEILVEIQWADYVFDTTYNLFPILEVEEYILKNKHLPNVPSSKEVESNGLSLGDITKIQQEKIEELFLYTIEQEKEIIKLKLLLEKVNELEKKVDG